MGWFTSFSTRAAVLAALVISVAAFAGCAREKRPAAPTVTARPHSPADSGAGDSVQEKPAKPEKQSGTKKAQEPPDPSAEAQPSIMVTQEGVTLNWKEDGELRMSARARELKADEVSRTGKLVDFTAKLYENGKLTASIEAPSAVADTVKREVTATGGVTVRSTERATTVRADWMRWYASKQKIIGVGRVRIDSAMGSVSAAAFTADTSMRTLTVKDSAKGLEL